MNPREKSMMKSLGLIAFIGLNLIIYSFYADKKKALDVEKNKLTQEILLRNTRLEEGAVWNDADAWFSENNPVQMPIEDAQNALLNEVRASAQRCALELNPSKPINYLPSLPAGELQRARVSISFSAPELKFFEWVTQINNAKLFRALTNLSIIPHATDNTRITVDAVIEQWIDPNLPDPTPELEPPATPPTA